MTDKFTKSEYLGLKNPNWWTQECPATFGLCYSWMRGFLKVQEYYGKGYEVATIPFKNDYGWHFLDRKKSIELADHIFKQFTKSSSYLKKRQNIWRKKRVSLLQIFKKIEKTNLSRLDSKELWNIYNNLEQAYHNEYTPALISEAFEPYTSDVIYKKLQRFTKEKRRKLSVLEQPSFKSFMTVQQIDLLKLESDVFRHPNLKKLLTKEVLGRAILRKIKNNFKDFNTKLEAHAEKYFWLKNNYHKTPILTPAYFLKEIQGDLRQKNKANIWSDIKKLRGNPGEDEKRKKQVIKELKLEKDLVKFFELMEIISAWQDERKRLMLIASFYLNKILKKIGQIKKYTLSEMQYMHPKEIKALLVCSKKIDRKLLHSRRTFSFWTGKGNKEYWFCGKDIKKFKKIFFPESKIEQKSITGIPASPGIVTGNARIVLNSNRDKFYQDEILITSMTRPDFVPLMRKARAVVTNEGGLTCHAAIICRELGIPCVVGTKIATKVFKSGDIIEVRAHRGSVQKVKDNKQSENE